MITFSQAVLLGILQGVSELFPVSSLGHSIIIPGLLGWHLNMEAGAMLEFLVATHFATAAVLFLFYWKDWFRIIGGVLRSLAHPRIAMIDTNARLGWLLIAGTVPAGLIGVIFQKKLQALFTDPRTAALFLIANGALLFGAELLRRRRAAQAAPEIAEGGDERIARLSGWSAIKVGIMQVLALFPGISRTGATFAGSLWEGLSHEDALRFSFLLATPIIGGAALLELPKLIHAGGQLLTLSLAGAIAAACAAYFSVKFLVRYFKTKTLIPFAVYCVALGLLGALLSR